MIYLNLKKKCDEKNNNNKYINKKKICSKNYGIKYIRQIFFYIKLSIK